MAPFFTVGRRSLCADNGPVRVVAERLPLREIISGLYMICQFAVFPTPAGIIPVLKDRTERVREPAEHSPTHRCSANDESASRQLEQLSLLLDVLDDIVASALNRLSMSPLRRIAFHFIFFVTRHDYRSPNNFCVWRTATTGPQLRHQCHRSPPFSALYSQSPSSQGIPIPSCRLQEISEQIKGIFNSHSTTVDLT